MRNKITTIFKKNNNIIIGVIHFPPLSGYKNSPGLKVALKNSLQDLAAFKNGPVDGIIIENNYDIPHQIKVSKKIINDLTYLSQKIRPKTNLPLGINVLWNDYQASLTIAKKTNLQFVRVPVFVDKIKTNYGIIDGQPDKIIKFRKKIKAENIAIMADIHVKHSEILSKLNITKSAKLAIKKSADAIILTGKWTGQAPNLKKLKLVREVVGKFPIFVGSGADENNLKKILKYANGVIVSTSLKKGSVHPNEVNIKTWRQRIDKSKVRRFVAIIK